MNEQSPLFPSLTSEAVKKLLATTIAVAAVGGRRGDGTLAGREIGLFAPVRAA